MVKIVRNLEAVVREGKLNNEQIREILESAASENRLSAGQVIGISTLAVLITVGLLAAGGYLVAKLYGPEWVDLARQEGKKIVGDIKNDMARALVDNS